jgi:hypothetical protein
MDHRKAIALLIEGCILHPGYRAKKTPRVKCPTCWQLFKTRGPVLTQLKEKAICADL